MIIEVNQLPPASSSPNSRAFWAKRYSEAAVYRTAVLAETMNKTNILMRTPGRHGYPPFEKPRITLKFIFAQNRRRDEDNLRARFKPGLDAIVHSGIIKDDSLEAVVIDRPVVVVDRNRAPMTIIEIKEQE